MDRMLQINDAVFGQRIDLWRTLRTFLSPILSLLWFGLAIGLPGGVRAAFDNQHVRIGEIQVLI